MTSIKNISVFLVSHGSIDAKLEQITKDHDPEVDRYHFSIRCQTLPVNTGLYMPNILGKPYYENRETFIRFIDSKIEEWSPAPSATVTDSASKPRERERDRTPEPRSSFSEFIATSLTRFEEVETEEISRLMKECEEKDSVAYNKRLRMQPKQKDLRRSMSKAEMLKNGIKWEKLGCYIPEKHYIHTGEPGEDVLLVVEEFDAHCTRTAVHKVVDTSLTPGRKDLAQVYAELRSILKLVDTVEIYFFDFACSTINFKDIPDLEPYWPNLLSYESNGDSGATLIYATIPKDRYEEMAIAEKLGFQFGVGFGDDPDSMLTLGSQGSQPDSFSEGGDSSKPARPTPFLYVKVPKEAKSIIYFGRCVFEAGQAGGIAVAGGPANGGSKRKYTKRKRNVKKSYRKRRVTRRRYKSRRCSKMNR